jgi:hypothetical protein
MAPITAPRLKGIDNDCRREPKTNRFCIRCQRDLPAGAQERMIHLVESCMAVHPEDEGMLATFAHEDHGWWLVGVDCAKIIGLEYTHPVVDEEKIKPNYPTVVT